MNNDNKNNSGISGLMNKALGVFGLGSKQSVKKPVTKVTPNTENIIKKESNESKEKDKLDNLLSTYWNEDDSESDNSDSKKNESNKIEKKEQKVEKPEKSYVSEEKSEKGGMAEKFANKSGIRKPKSLAEIAKESKQKADELSGKAFAEGDAAKKDLKKVEAGYNSVVKKKTLSALDDKLFLIRGKDRGRAAWHYVLIPHENAKKLKMQKIGASIDVTDFGKIVKSGWGEEPAKHIIEEMEALYGETQ
jgi:hypothetical protein